jgi:hypothetical protein
MRWPDPIEATVRMRGAFNNFPRLPYQLGNAARRIAAFIDGLIKSSSKAD